MPTKPKTHKLATLRTHRPLIRDNRPTCRQRGYTGKWSAASKTYLEAHPWCVDCLRHGLRVRSEVVDHIIPHKGNATIFWDRRNWQALCKSCNSRKCCDLEGGFGHKQKPGGRTEHA